MKKLDRSVERALLGEHYSEFIKIRDDYFKMLGQIKEHLKENPLTPLYEQHIMGKVFVSDLGTLYATTQELPPLEDLRVMAERSKIDISDLGRSRKKIFERLQGSEMVSQNTEDTISKKIKKHKKVQDIRKAPMSKDTENQSNSKAESDSDFDFLDDVEDAPVNLSLADFEETQTDEERELLERMISLGSRGGSLEKVLDRVDLDSILAEKDR